ncbi:MAG: molybdopterin cofactor-binding domain-containing protein [Rhodospirillales bacterium]
MMDGDRQTGLAGRTIAFTVNGSEVEVTGDPMRRLADALRGELGLTGTKIGCNAGDCGACTLLLDGAQVCGCMVPVGQVAGREVVTVEGLEGTDGMNRLQEAFQRHGAAQCGICTPGMLMAATDLLASDPSPDRQAVMDALGGVLCRCTGYQKIVEAVLDAAAATSVAAVAPEPGGYVGARVGRTDGFAKITGRAQFGADGFPADALWLRVVRSPQASAKVELGDFTEILSRPGIERVLTAADVPFNGFGIYPDIKDQPVLTDKVVRYRGQAVVAVVGTREAIDALDLADIPITYTPLPSVTGVVEAMADGAPQVLPDRPGNLLIDGRVRKGDAAAGFASAACVAEDDFRTAFVEHAYIEPEAGWARRVGDRIEITACTQAPYMDRDETANVMQLAPEAVRIVPTACGGGFGGKLDISVQPLVAVAAWLTGKPVATVYERPESMMSSTKRHPSTIHAKFACDRDGYLQACAMDAIFNTGAYASWGPTVAGRVPVHASGPYFVPNVENRGRAYFTNEPPSGAFRGFGVPQAAIAHECLLDDLAEQTGLDRLEFRRRNAIAVGQETACGQVLKASAGLGACIDALRAPWDAALAEARSLNAKGGRWKRGVGIGCMWYGIGNTSMSNPSTIRIGLKPDGRFTLFSGAVDIGQGSYTIVPQIVADALGVGLEHMDFVFGDTDLTPDAGKTSASRQTFVTGKAAELAGLDLRAQILRAANAGPDAAIRIEGGRLVVGEEGSVIDPARLPLRDDGFALMGEGTFDPPTEPLDANGQGVPYATYGFAAQVAVVDVDPKLGLVKVRRIHAAHDVGKAINPTQVEGQIHGGIAQGLGLALMEEYLPGRTENLHDYLIPTFGDMPEMDVILVEDEEPLGPYGAKGVGEPGLVATAPAIFGAVRHAVGVRVRQAPLLPHRLRELVRQKEGV